MAIALVQKTAQQFYDGVTTASRTITGVTAGNLVTATVGCASQPNTSPVPALPTPSGWLAAIAPSGSTGIDAYRGIAGIFYKANAASGSHTIDFSGGAALPTDSYAEITLEEWSGIDTSGLFDVAASSALATPQTSGTSGTTATTTAAGTEAQDRSLALTRAAAETSAGTESQNRTLAVARAAAESAAGSTAQERTVAFTTGTAESSAGTTAQDFTAGAIFDAAESSTPSTAQDRTVVFTAGNVAESSAGSTSQTHDALPPVNLGQSSLRRWLIQKYVEGAEARAKARQAEKEAEAAPALKAKRPTLRLKKSVELDYEDRLSKAIAMAQSLMLDHGADNARMYSLIMRTTKTKALVTKAKETLATAAALDEQPDWRKLGQADWSDDDLLLLAHAL